MFRRLNCDCLKSKFVLPELVVDGGVVEHVDISVAGDARFVGPVGRVTEVHHVIMQRYLMLFYTKRNKKEYLDSIYCYKMNILSVTTPDTNCLIHSWVNTKQVYIDTVYGMPSLGRSFYEVFY